jgi:hypothetical protein
MFAVRAVELSPQIGQAGLVVGELVLEIRDGVPLGLVGARAAGHAHNLSR